MAEFDNALVEELLAEDEVDEDTVIRLCEPLIQGILEASTFPREDFDTLAQVGRIKIMKILRGRKYDKSRGRAYSFLYRSVKNRMMSWLKRRKKISQFPVEDKEPKISPPTDLEMDIGLTTDDIEKDIQAGCSQNQVVGKLRNAGVKRREALLKYKAAMVRLRERLSDYNRLKRLPCAQIAEVAVKLLTDTPLSPLLDILTPHQTAKVLFLFSGLSVEFPKMDEIMKLVCSDTERPDCK